MEYCNVLKVGKEQVIQKDHVCTAGRSMNGGMNEGQKYMTGQSGSCPTHGWVGEHKWFEEIQK